MIINILLIFNLLIINQLFASDFFDLSAHRGDHAKYTENTLNSLKSAITNGANSIEFDVHLSIDGVPFIYHDFVLKKNNFNGLSIDTPIKDLSFNKLSKLYYNDLEKSPLLNLSDLLSAMRDLKAQGYDFLMHMEIKINEATNIDQMIKIISKEIKFSKLKKRILVRSFDINFLYSFKEKVPNTGLVILFDKGLIPGKLEVKKLIQDLHPFGIAPHHTDVTQELMAKSYQLNFLVLPWTVDNKKVAKRLINLGVHGITTNYPQRFQKQLNNRNISESCYANIYKILSQSR